MDDAQAFNHDPVERFLEARFPAAADGQLRRRLLELQADLLNGAKLLEWEGQIGSLEAGFLADVIAVEGNPLQDIGVLGNVSFVMKGGEVVKSR